MLIVGPFILHGGTRCFSSKCCFRFGVSEGMLHAAGIGESGNLQQNISVFISLGGRTSGASHEEREHL